MIKNILIVALLLMGTTAYAQEIFATPVATPELLADPDQFIPESELRDFLIQAVEQVNSLPDDPSFVGSVQIVPNETATQLFSYAKWLFSFQAAQELLGITFAPVGMVLYSVLLLTVVGATIWFTLKIVTLILRMISYVARWIMRLLLRGG